MHADAAPSRFARLLRAVLLGALFAGQHLRHSRMRIALAVIGVAIGIASVTSMLVLGHSIDARLRQSLDSLGADVVTLAITSRIGHMLPNGSYEGTVLPIGVEDSRTIWNVLRAMPEVTAQATFERIPSCPRGEPMGDYETHRIDLAMQPLLALRTVEGSLLVESDATPAIVAGAQAWKRLRESQPEASVGREVMICGRSFRVAGVLAAHPGTEIIEALRIDHALLLNGAASRQLTTALASTSGLIKLRDGLPARAAANRIARRLSGLLEDRPIKVVTAGAWQVSEVRREQIALYTRFLAIVGGVSLLVSSLGIANVMLAAVAERRREIGLRVALGAAPLDITVQFMVESVAICLVGGLAGLALGVGVAGLTLSLVGYGLALSFGTLVMPALLAALCGLAAGIYPARLAARADPISSLQGV